MDLRNRVLYDFGHGLVLNMDDMHDPVLMQQLKNNLQQKPASELTVDEKMSLEHIRLHEEHQGHDAMHMKIVIIVVSTLIISQFLLLFWRRYHYKSYQLASLAGLWMIPMVVSLKHSWWRFIFVWLLFTTVTGTMFMKCRQTPIGRTVPRLVYRWFYGIHRVSYASGVIGYFLLLSNFLGIHKYLSFVPNRFMEHSVVMVYYGLYFGVLGRDLAEICSDMLAAQMGYCSANGMPTRAVRRDVCAVCGNEMACSPDDYTSGEKVYILNCSHKFHEFCIRGWCIVGKKQTCPCCREKVDLQQIFRNPWQKTHILYTQVLDFMRYIVAWQPLIISIAQIVTWLSGYK